MTVVATLNVQASLDGGAAAHCLSTTLSQGPDVVALQEWGPRRASILYRTGPVHVAGTRIEYSATSRVSALDATDWIVPAVGDCVIGLRRARFDLVRHRTVYLGGFGRADRGSRWPPVLPPRFATVVEASDRQRGVHIGLVVYHLVPGSQSRGAYRVDRPLIVARHRAETTRLQQEVDNLLEHCEDVIAAGDSNFHGFALEGLTSAWSGRPGSEGTLTSYRRIDDVLSTLVASGVTLTRTESDHSLVVVHLSDDRVSRTPSS